MLIHFLIFVFDIIYCFQVRKICFVGYFNKMLDLCFEVNA